MEIYLTPAEVDALLRAINEILDGNGRDLDELKKSGWDKRVVRALTSLEGKLRDAI